MADANTPLLPQKSDKTILIVLLVCLIFSVAVSAVLYFGFKEVKKNIDLSWWDDVKAAYSEAFFPDQKENTGTGATKDVSSSSPAVTNVNSVKCRSNMHLENGSCFINVKPCQIENGFGRTNWTGQDWAPCLVNSCQNGYKISGNGCVSESGSGKNVCTDSDSGLNYGIKGTVVQKASNGETWTYSDYCADEREEHSYFETNSCQGEKCYVLEFYGDSNGSCQFAFFNCPKGCSNGACIQ